MTTMVAISLVLPVFFEEQHLIIHVLRNSGIYLGSPNGVTNGPHSARLGFPPDAVPDRAVQISIVDVTISDRFHL